MRERTRERTRRQREQEESGSPRSLWLIIIAAVLVAALLFMWLL